jgi:hypothetical protein
VGNFLDYERLLLVSEMRPIRVILDSNVFSKANFDALNESRFRDLCRVGRIEAIYPDIILDELLRSYQGEQTRPQLIDRWLPFIINTTSGFWLELLEIWHHELVRDRGINAPLFKGGERAAKIVHQLRTLPRDGTWPIVVITQAERDSIAEGKKLFREQSKDMRNRFESDDAWIAALYWSNPKLVRDLGPGYIKRQLRAKNSDVLSSQWLLNPDRYPYVTQAVKNAMFMLAYPVVDKSAAIDINAQADLDVMTHLLSADILVTNEKKFMKSAFEVMWHPNGKILFDLDELVGFINKL